MESTILEYQLRRPYHVGGGSIGDVYMCTNHPAHNQVAVKELKKPPDGRSLADRLADDKLREAAALCQQLPGHVNVVQFLGLGRNKVDHDGVGLFYMYCNDDTLADVLLRRKMSRKQNPLIANKMKEADALRYMRQIRSGLKHIHDRGLYHCNLKPANIVVTPEGQLKILDTGFIKIFECFDPSGDQLSRSLFSETTLPGYADPAAWKLYKKTGILIGSPEWDIWSAGVILYELISNMSLFDTQDEWTTFLDSPHAQLVVDSKLNDEVKKESFHTEKYIKPLNIKYECLKFLKDCLQTNRQRRLTLGQFYAHKWWNSDTVWDESCLEDKREEVLYVLGRTPKSKTQSEQNESKGGQPAERKIFTLARGKWAEYCRLPRPLREVCLISYSDRIYLFGGIDEKTNSPTKEIYYINSYEDEPRNWHYVADLPEASVRLEGCIVKKLFIYLVSGGLDRSKTFVYNTVSDECFTATDTFLKDIQKATEECRTYNVDLSGETPLGICKLTRDNSRHVSPIEWLPTERSNVSKVIERRRKHLLVSVSENEFFAVGGEDSAAVEFYTLDSHDYRQLLCFPMPPMKRKRLYPAAVMMDGMLYVAGGIDAEEQTDGYVEKEIEKLNTITAEWSQVVIPFPGCVIDEMIAIQVPSSRVSQLFMNESKQVELQDDRVTQLLKYKKLKRLGSGSFATVYECHLSDDPVNKVAVKVLNNHRMLTPETVLREIAQIDEVKVHLKVKSHLNIINFLGIGQNERQEDEDEWGIVFEYCSHGDLKTYLSKSNRTLSEDDVFGYMYQICSGLKAMHDEGIIHRDLKPANILVACGGREDGDYLKIGDFGLNFSMKKLTHPLQERTTESLDDHRGTRGYADPVVWKQYNDTGQCRGGRKWDIWSVGAILYELICGVPLFVGHDEWESFVRSLQSQEIIDDKIEDHLPEGVSSELREFLKGCLQTNLQDRNRFSYADFYAHPYWRGKFEPLKSDL